MITQGVRGYDALYVGPLGIKLYAFPKTGTHVHIEIPGEAIEQITHDRLISYLVKLPVQGY